MERSSFTECWVGLVFISPAAPMYGTSVRCTYNVCSADLHPHLANRLQEWQRLDIADRTADLDHRHIGVGRALADTALDLVGDMRNDLHRAPR